MPSRVPDPPSKGSPAERQAVYMYRTQIANLLASAFDLKFWTYDLLQTAEAFHTVRHAVAALAAAYHTFIVNSHGDLGSQRHFVLDQYNKSISSLHKCLHRGNRLSRRQQVVIMITNLLFNSVCALQGLQAEACVHLRSGLALLHEWKIGTAVYADGSGVTPTPVKLLVAMYMRMDTQARIIINATGREYEAPYRSHIASLDGWEGGCQGTAPEAFTELDRVYNRTLQATRGVPLGGTAHPTLLQAVENYRRQLSLWDSSFGCLLKEEIHNCKSASTLRMHRHLADANLELLERGRGYATPGSLEASCEAMLDLAIETIQASGLQEGKMTFSPAGNLIEVLYFVARHCPDRSIQQQAIGHLANNAVIEGLWRSEAAADIAAAALG